MVEVSAGFFEVKLFGHAREHTREGQLDLLRPCRIGWLHERRHCTFDHASSTAFSGLDAKTSCCITSLAMMQQAVPGARSGTIGQGVVGCALEITGKSYKAMFAIDGDWTASTLGSGRDSVVGINRCEWIASAADGPVFPAASGRLACEFVFDSSQFSYGPPDSSFMSVASAGIDESGLLANSGTTQLSPDVIGAPALGPDMDTAGDGTV